MSANDEDGIPDPEVDTPDTIWEWAQQPGRTDIEILEMKNRVDLQIGRIRAELERADARDARYRWVASAKRARARFGWLGQQLQAMLPGKRKERHEADQRERQASFQAAAKAMLPPEMYEAVLAEFIRRREAAGSGGEGGEEPDHGAPSRSGFGGAGSPGSRGTREGPPSTDR
jgi:hypothetical protein